MACAVGEACAAGRCSQLCSPSAVAIVACESSSPEVKDCIRTNHGGGIYAECALDKSSKFCSYAGNCTEGCISRLWLRYDMGTSQNVRFLRYQADWWGKRPDHWELWASDDPKLVPKGGAVLVAAGVGAKAPWVCKTGDPCTPEVPDACCPDGRQKPQDTRMVGEAHAKYDDAWFHPTRARYWYFVIVDTDDDVRLILTDIQFYSDLCD